MKHPRVWVENPNRVRTIQEKEENKFTALLIKLVKWEEYVVPIGIMFEGDPVGFKSCTSPSAPKATNHSRKEKILVITKSMFNM